MPPELVFPDSPPQYLFDRDVLVFSVDADRRPVSCFVTAELLYSDFGAKGTTEVAMRHAYQEHLADIQAVARNHIENGWVDDQERIFLTTRYTRMKVTYAEELRGGFKTGLPRIE